MINIIPNTANHTHWQVAQNSRASQNLPKSMVAPTLTEKKMKKHGHTTIDTTAYPPSSETQGIIIRYVQLRLKNEI